MSFGTGFSSSTEIVTNWISLNVRTVTCAATVLLVPFRVNVYSSLPNLSGTRMFFFLFFLSFLLTQQVGKHL